MAGFRTRAVSAVVLVAVLGSALYFGGYYLWALMLFASETGFFEFSRAMRDPSGRDDMKPDILELLGYCGIAVLYIVMLVWDSDVHIMYTLILLLIALMIVYVLQFPRYPTSKMMQIYFGVVYVGLMLSFVYLTRMEKQGLKLVWLIFISSWIPDTGAYFVGVKFGKHKLIPDVSPKKTVEGAVGGIITCMIVFIIFTVIVNAIGKIHLNYLLMILASVLLAVASMIGDLIASLVKRHYNVKDYGTILPGHGGVMDRFDSVLATSSILFVLSLIPSFINNLVA